LEDIVIDADGRFTPNNSFDAKQLGKLKALSRVRTLVRGNKKAPLKAEFLYQVIDEKLILLKSFSAKLNSVMTRVKVQENTNLDDMLAHEFLMRLAYHKNSSMDIESADSPHESLVIDRDIDFDIDADADVDACDSGWSSPRYVFKYT
jgi:hypothetical protein